MKRASILGMCLAVVLAAGAMTAVGASAAPPEFSPPFPNAFHSTSKAMTLETAVSKLKVTCKKDTNKGEVTGPATALVTIAFTGCKSTAVPGALCNSANGLPGEIVTERLLGVLGYTMIEPVKEVGLDLSTPTGGPMVVFFCGALKGEVFGSVIGRIAPLNKASKKLTLSFAQAAGHQAITHFLGGPIDVPKTTFGGPLEESGLASADKITLAAPVVIIA
jgi:hypothetical protein